MPNVALQHTTRRWFRRSLAVVIAIDLLAGAGVALLHANDGAAPLSTDDAVAAFRIAQAETPNEPQDGAVGAEAETTAPTSTPGAVGSEPGVESPGTAAPAADPSSPSPAAQPPSGAATSTDPAADQHPRPTEGVYTYTTTGHESLDALGGARHDYPAETSVTIRYAGCGLRERWQPLEDRYDERSVCTTASTHDIEWYESSRSFFGQRDTRRLECDAGAVAFSLDAPVGTEYRHRCVDPDTDARNVVTVLPDEDITIDGQVIRARRIRAVSDVTGDSRAHSEIQSWVHPDTGLTLRRESLLDGTSAGPSGEVRYHEEYTLQLRSLRPRT